MILIGDFYVRFWGVRGSICCPGPRTLRYGGNTSCLEVRCGEHLFILDAGTGMRALGEHLGNNNPLSVDIFLTHTHFDHINGFPFFAPAYNANNTLRIWAGHGNDGIEAIFQRFMRAPFFPISLDTMRAKISFHDFVAGETLSPAPAVSVRTAPLNHPNEATGYRIDYRGKSICYVTDTEHRSDGPDKDILGLIHGADIVIYDSTYSEEEYAIYRGWGHSTWQEGVKLCRLGGVPTFVAFHHNPNHDDDFLDRMADQLNQVHPGGVVAREGMELSP